MRSREIIVPRNVPVENFSSAWSDKRDKSEHCSVCPLCIYLVVVLLVLGIAGVMIFIVLNGKIGALESELTGLSDNRQGLQPNCQTCNAGSDPGILVCGSDGITYPTACQLEQTACMEGRNVTAMFLGRCDLTGWRFVSQTDPCQSVVCPAGSVCHLGTDGQTVCAENPCKFVLSVKGDKCEVDQHGVSDCVCGTDCEEEHTPALSCPSGQWGVGDTGCQPCLCSEIGTAGHDCEKTTGQCLCRPGHTGHKCDICPGGQVEKSRGCHHVKTVPEPESGVMSDRQFTHNIGVSSLIGHMCMTHSDCVRENTECVRGECSCRRGFIPSTSLLCKEDPSPCSSFPCEGGGTCEEHDGTFTCYCREGRLGKFCQEEIENTNIRVASFQGKSYVRLKKIPNSVIRTSIKLRFRTFFSSGLLFYSSEYQSGMPGDKLEISVVDHHVQLSYDLGGGSVTIRCVTQVTLGVWHSLHVQRYRGDAILQINDQDPVTGRVDGSSLNLGNYSFIGGVPDREGRVTRGLEGCLKDLKFGHQPVSLVSIAEPLLVSSHGVGECARHPCRSFPCRHSGECLTLWGEEIHYRCLCRKGYTGTHCERRRGHCHQNPCQNGGQCHHTEGFGVVCSCDKGWGGKLCDLNLADEKRTLSTQPFL